ncbi:MAG: hypothetical protein AB1589_27105 [Cyanobacteriota bacterium]
MSVIPRNLLNIALCSRQLSSKLKIDERWPTFEEMLQNLHAKGIYIHPDQLAEFLLAHGLPVHLRYVPVHLRSKAIRVNENYQGDMVKIVEELDSPSWDFSWMENIQEPFPLNNHSYSVDWFEQREQPSWDYSWMK